MQDRFLGWIVKVEWCTPGYLVRDKFQREKLRRRAGMKTWRYERKLGERKGNELTRLCWEDLRGRAKRGKVVGE